MLGKNVRVKVTKPYNSYDNRLNLKYMLNFGLAEVSSDKRTFVHSACIMGISHPVRVFEGRVIAYVKHTGKKPNYIVVAPKRSRFIIHEIEDAISFYEKDGNYTIECLYESSCGAVVFRDINGSRRFLLIKNKRSSHWGFPKGHIERGESKTDTAKREVFEETGLHIDIYDGFEMSSDYKIAGRVEKNVTVFVGSTEDTQTVIQKEEIEDYIWLEYEKAYSTLKFENDKVILRKAFAFLNERGI